MIDLQNERNAYLASSSARVILDKENSLYQEFIWDIDLQEVACLKEGATAPTHMTPDEAEDVIVSMLADGYAVESGELPFEIEPVEQEVVEEEIEGDELEQMLETASFTDRLTFGSVVVNFSWTHDAQVLVHMTEGKYAMYPSTASAWVLWKSLVEIGFEVVGKRKFMNGV